MPEETIEKNPTEELYYGTPQPVAGLRGVKLIRRKLRGTVFIASLTTNAGAIHLGTFLDVHAASERYDVCKRLFLLLIGDAAKLVERAQYNDPKTALDIRTPDDCRKQIPQPFLRKVESLAAATIAGRRRTSWAPKVTREDFAERLTLLETKLARALDEIESLKRKLPATTETP